ncbi:serine hydrolase [Roseivirga sp.]|uniref:serine hydrolase n=1 Tax=Roseivirga sp. TaxID=1964215 RepID=UPI003B8ADD4E
MKKILALTLLFVSTLSLAQNTALNERIKRIENGLMPALQIKGETPPTYNVNERLKQLGIPGLSVAFVNNGKIEWARAYGMADVANNKPMTNETMLLAGSISKPIAALRAHQMVENGQLSLDTNVNDYLTSWKLPDNEFTVNEKVTLRRILNHTAGLTVWGFPGYDKGDDIPSVPDVLDGKGNTDAVRVYKEPGKSWMYSGGGYTIMQLMMTDVEGISFPETMQKHILNPLGMEKSTFVNPLPEKYHSMAATGYRGNGQEVEGKWPIYPEMAAAGLWTTPSQLIQFAIELQKINKSKTDGILKYSSVEAMLTPGMNDHGLGPQASKERFGHGGADEGFRANLVAWKNEPYALVVMVNSDNGQIMQEIQLAIAKEYDLTGIEADVREVVKMTSEDFEKYTGKFQVGDIGVVEVENTGKSLLFKASFIQQRVELVPQSETNFFDKADGTPIVFELKDGKVTGFKVQGLQATRTN